ncbi:MAG: hypothetical protein R6X29_04960 [Acidimicrobiia bacterium]|jgi:hypothetical protein
MGLLDILIAVGIFVVIWRASLWVIRMLSTPPPEVDPEDVVEVDQDFRCSVCGTEVTLRMINVQESTPPKHCREEMVPVWRPGPG